MWSASSRARNTIELRPQDDSFVKVRSTLRKHGGSWSSSSQAKWENPEELGPELELDLGAQLDPDLDSKCGPAQYHPGLDLEPLGDQDKECSKTMPIGHCNQKEEPGHF